MPDDKGPEPAPFWRLKRLGEMTQAEWESLCDGCGRCCLNKLIDEDTNETVFTDVGCKLLDGETCRCTDYAHRQAKVKDCVRLTPRNVRRLTWLPPTCGYRLVAEGRDLYWWHPLKSGERGDGARGRRLGARARLGEREGRAGRASWRSTSSAGRGRCRRGRGSAPSKGNEGAQNKDNDRLNSWPNSRVGCLFRSNSRNPIFMFFLYKLPQITGQIQTCN